MKPGRNELAVYCERCGHERVLFALPAPLDIVAAACKLRCAACNSKRVMLGPRPKSTDTGDFESWINNGDTGVSSATIWAVLLRRPNPYCTSDVPHDPGDFGRCYRLLAVMPEWRERLPEVARVFPGWAPLVDRWDELTSLWEEESPSGNAPKLYALMRELLQE